MTNLYCSQYNENDLLSCKGNDSRSIHLNQSCNSVALFLSENGGNQELMSLLVLLTG